MNGHMESDMIMLAVIYGLTQQQYHQKSPQSYAETATVL